MVCPAQLPLLCVVESNRLRVSTLHAGHLQAFTRGQFKDSLLYRPEDDPHVGSQHVAY